MIIALLVILLIALLLAGLVLFMKHQAHGINKFFCNAVRVRMFTGNLDARDAAIAAAQVAAGQQRESMVTYLDGMSTDLSERAKEDLEMNHFAQEFQAKLADLIKEIRREDWTIEDIRKAKENLQA